MYKECGKGTDKNSKLYLNWLKYECCLLRKSLQSSKSECGLDIGDVHVSEDTRRTVLIMSTVYNGAAQQMAKEIEETKGMGTEDPCPLSLIM